MGQNRNSQRYDAVANSDSYDAIRPLIKQIRTTVPKITVLFSICKFIKYLQIVTFLFKTLSYLMYFRTVIHS